VDEKIKLGEDWEKDAEANKKGLDFYI